MNSVRQTRSGELTTRVMGDKSARQQNNSKGKHLSFAQMVKLCCYCTTKYDTKVDIHVGEQPIFFLYRVIIEQN
jgi:hypothetical protein